MDSAAALTVFATLFVVIDPIALAPLFVALTRGLDAAHRRVLALRACLVAIGVLTLFGLFGETILSLIGISMSAFRISGGLLLFLIAVEMLFEKRTQRRSNTAEEAHDPSVFPLAVPLIAGPGSMAAMVLLAAQSGGSWSGILALHGIMVTVVAVTFIFFLASTWLDHLLGKNGINVITRLLGILLAALAVQIVLDGFGGYGLFPV